MMKKKLVIFLFLKKVKKLLKIKLKKSNFDKNVGVRSKKFKIDDRDSDSNEGVNEIDFGDEDFEKVSLLNENDSIEGSSFLSFSVLEAIRFLRRLCNHPEFILSPNSKNNLSTFFSTSNSSVSSFLTKISKKYTEEEINGIEGLNLVEFYFCINI
jgi:hypothetical protein